MRGPTSVAPQPLPSFGSAPTLEARPGQRSERRKLASAEQDALETFQRFQRDPDGLIDHLQRQGVQVYAGKQHPGVNQYLEKAGMNAGLYSPYSRTREKNSADWQDPSIPPALQEVVEDCETRQHFALFLRNGATLTSLVHEAFHFFQAMAGLRLKSDDLQADHRAGRYFGILLTKMGSPQRKREVVSDLKTIASQDPTALEALNIRLHREQEVSHFLLKHGPELKVPVDHAHEQHRVAAYGQLLDISEAV